MEIHFYTYGYLTNDSVICWNSSLKAEVGLSSNLSSNIFHFFLDNVMYSNNSLHTVKSLQTSKERGLKKIISLTYTNKNSYGKNFKNLFYYPSKYIYPHILKKVEINIYVYVLFNL